MKLQFTDFVSQISDLLNFKQSETQGNGVTKVEVLNEAMSCCHAITYVGDELVGDPLEVKMFEMTGWKLEEDIPGSNSIA